MLHVIDSKSKGLDISVEVHETTKIAILDALLSSANIQFVKMQNDRYHIHFKVDAGDAAKIRVLIDGWATATGDIQYATATRSHTA